ncbi:MAG: xylulokinase [Candidatus Lokiarchaeota archaeon]|nr:xylulokinase [Candidatus Lokiarchaeota archaeon]
MKELVLAIDAGTTGIRSMVFDISGKVVAKSYREFKSFHPHPSWVEQDAATWWDSTCKTISSCMKDLKHRSKDIVGLSVTNQRETIVPIDENGNALRRAIVWQDRRTAPQCDWIRKQIGIERIYEDTGLTIDPYFSGPKILWILKNEPEVFRKTEKFLLVHDYLIYMLTGHTITDYSNASRTMLLELDSAKWSESLLEQFDIPKEKLPDLVASGDCVGEVSPKAARNTGLAEGIPVVAGGGDQQCAALGVGVVRPGRIKTTTGTGTFMLAFSQKPKRDPERRVLCSRHVVPDAFVVEASMFTTGSALRWFRDNLAVEECNFALEHDVDPYDVMTDAAKHIPAGSEGVVHIPHFVGAGAPYWNSYARGVFAGLSLGHTRNHLMRAILEGVGYEIRTNLDVMRELSLTTSEMRVTGGASRSDVWMQIQADILGIPVITTQMEEATAVGAAILACKGVGIFKSISEAAEEMIRPNPAIIPSSANREIYEQGYETYRKLYSHISDIRWGSD